LQNYPHRFPPARSPPRLEGGDRTSQWWSCSLFCCAKLSSLNAATLRLATTTVKAPACLR